MRKSPKKKKKEIVVCTSGGFDPVHPGHINMFNAAKKLGDKHVVILNGDGWLMRKKGKFFMSAQDRREVLLNLRSVDDSVIWDDGRDDVSAALASIRPHIFANGGDRTDKNTPEKKVCRKLGIKMVFNVGGKKIRSSSELLGRYNLVLSERP